MANKIQTSIGIEYTPTALRAVLVDGVPEQWTVKSFREIKGDFTKKLTYVEALKELKSTMGFSSSDLVAVSISGKQVYVAQIPFKAIPENEMKNALRFEIRQNLPFESGNASLNYQWVGENQVLAVVAGFNYYQHQVDCFHEAGLNLQIMDVLPLCLANSLWARKIDDTSKIAQICLHFGEDTCSLIMDGKDVPFYARSIQFRIGKLSASADQSVPASDIASSLEQLGAELRRSLNFYEKNHESKDFGKIALSGSNATDPRILKTLQDHVGLALEPITMKSLFQNTDALPEFEYDVALTLGLRGVGQ
jgi:Tfp pilus assembly PilM family ATPase